MVVTQPDPGFKLLNFVRLFLWPGPHFARVLFEIIQYFLVHLILGIKLGLGELEIREMGID